LNNISKTFGGFLIISSLVNVCLVIALDSKLKKHIEPTNQTQELNSIKTVLKGPLYFTRKIEKL